MAPGYATERNPAAGCLLARGGSPTRPTLAPQAGPFPDTAHPPPSLHFSSERGCRGEVRAVKVTEHVGECPLTSNNADARRVR